jgi:hypothetical protein
MTESIRDPTHQAFPVGRSEVEIYSRSDGRWGWCLITGSTVQFSRISYDSADQAAAAAMTEALVGGAMRR